MCILKYSYKTVTLNSLNTCTVSYPFPEHDYYGSIKDRLVSALRLRCQCTSSRGGGMLSLYLHNTCFPPRIFHFTHEFTFHSTMFLLGRGAWGIIKCKLSEGEFSILSASQWLRLPPWIEPTMDPSGHCSSDTQYKAHQGIHYCCCWRQKLTSWRDKEQAKQNKNQPTKNKKKRKTGKCFSRFPTQPTSWSHQQPPPKQSQDSDLKVGAAVVRCQSSNLIPATLTTLPQQSTHGSLEEGEKGEAHLPQEVGLVSFSYWSLESSTKFPLRDLVVLNEVSATIH